MLAQIDDLPSGMDRRDAMLELQHVVKTQGEQEEAFFPLLTEKLGLVELKDVGRAMMARQLMPAGHDVVDAAALWRSVLPTVAEISRARRRLHAKAVFIVAIVVVSYWAAVISAWSAAIRIGSAGVLAMGLIAVATGIMHDANHGAFSRHRWLNRLVSYVADILGTSSWLWRFKHNVLHHAATNIEGVDTDLAQAPFARLSPGQPWHSWHRYQHVYLWPLYGFMGLKNLIIGDLGNLAMSRIGPQALRTRPSRNDVLRIVAGKLAHLGLFVVVPVLYNPWWAVLVFYLCISWVVGFVLAVTFQLAHCVEGMLFTDESSPHRGKDFVAHQLATTTNVASPLPVIGHVFRWLVGGLDHQIEHHLGTRLPHTALAAVGGRFRLLCIDLGVDYHEHAGLWTGLRSHGRWLKRMGQPPSTASPQPVQIGLHLTARDSVLHR